jgi:Zn-dependent protease
MTWLPEFLAAALASILAITLHEAAHGYAALWLGDPTAKQAGRLSLNPIRHIDPVGTILLPAVLVVGQLLTLGRIEFMFGWAKPVPVNAMQLWRSPRRSPRLGMALVAAAGPLMNFFLAWAGGLLAQPALAQVREAVQRFIRGQAREIEVTLHPTQPVALMELQQRPPSNPADAVARLGLGAVAR